jgi:hypothetical protein
MTSTGSVLREVFEGIAGGKGLAVLIRAYFDESAEGKVGQAFLTVAGYVFDSVGLRGLEAKWKHLLRTYRLPYFHMAECNVDDPQPPNVFAHLDKSERIQAATDAIDIARRFPLHGAAYLLKQEDYKKVFEDDGFDCDPYSFLLWTSMIHVSKWRDQNKPKQSISLLFEQGYKTQSRANQLLQYVAKDSALRRGTEAGIISHSFFNKDCSYPGQAADLLAWHIRKGNSNLAAGKAVRGDTMALISERSIKTIHYDWAQLMLIRDNFVRHSGTLERASRILFNPEGPLLLGE